MTKIKNWNKGSGAFKIEEIAPPGVKGQLFTNTGVFGTTDWVDTNGDGLADDWGLNATPSYSIKTEGDIRFQRFTTVINGFEGLTQSTSLVNGKTYLIKIKHRCTATKKLRLFTIGATYKATTTAGTGDWQYEELLITDVTASPIYVTASDSGIGAVFDIASLSMSEVPEGYPLKDVGNKYLECTTDGKASLQSDTAYGTWEFDYYKGVADNLTYIHFMNSLKDASGDGYAFRVASNSLLGLYKINAGSTDYQFFTASSYIDTFDWFRTKIERLQSEGVFKDIPTLQIANIENSGSSPYGTFTDVSNTGFSAATTGATGIAATKDNEIATLVGEKYLVEFDMVLNSGTGPIYQIVNSISGSGAATPITVVGVNGRNSSVFTITAATYQVVRFYNTTASDYTISNLRISKVYGAGTFALFIKNNKYGTNTWNLITPDTGTNPITENTYTDSKYIVYDTQDLDKIANIKIKKGVEQ